jgi:importin subunit beta-1
MYITYLTRHDSVALLLPHAQSILELAQHCLSDEERTDALVRLALGLLGDLADCFPNGEIKQLLLSEWVAMELRSKGRLPPEVKKTLRWAREVCCSRPLRIDCLNVNPTDGQTRHGIDIYRSFPP